VLIVWDPTWATELVPVIASVPAIASIHAISLVVVDAEGANANAVAGMT
jgi:hypothetical protein